LTRGSEKEIKGAEERKRKGKKQMEDGKVRDYSGGGGVRRDSSEEYIKKMRRTTEWWREEMRRKTGRGRRRPK
jgi:hypothetical protein